MEKKSKAVYRHSMSYGLITGLVVVIISLIVYMIGGKLGENRIFQWSQILIIIIMVFLTQYRFKKENPEIYCSYGRMLGIGVLTGLSAALILGIYNYLFFKVIAPDVLEYMKQQAALSIENANLPQETMEQALETQKKLIQPGIMAIISFIQVSFMIFIFSLISSAITKSKNENISYNHNEDRPENEENEEK